MEAQTSSKRIHPLIAVAAVAVTLLSLTGVAAITGLLPNSQSASSPVAALDTKAEAGAKTEEKSDSKAAPSKKAETKPETNDRKTVRAAATPEPKRNATELREVRETRVSERPDYTQRAPQTARASYCDSCGRIESVQAIQQAAQPSGVGIAAGAVIGGLLGNQVGDGSGRKLATVAGAVGGGFAGNEVEKRTRSTTTYEIRVRMEDGTIQTLPQASSNGWQVGDRVKVVNGALVSNS